MNDDASVGTLPTGRSVADASGGVDATPDRSAAVVGAALDSIVTIDEQGRVVEFNPASEMLFGWTREEAIGRELDELFIPPAHAQAHRDGIRRYVMTGEGPVLNQRLELPAVRRDGTALVVELIAVPMVHDGRREFTGFIRDITELRRTQELLRESQARYEAIVRHSTMALVLCTPDGVDATFLAGQWLLGVPPGTRLDGGFASIVHPDDAPAATRLLAEVADGTRGPRDGVDLRLRRSDGSFVVCAVVGEDLTALPEVAALLVRADDVTQERQRERRLADATAQMRTLIDNLGSAVLLEDDTRHVLVANDVLVDLFRLPISAGDLVGTDCSESTHRIKALFADPEGFVSGVEQRVSQGFAIIGEQLSLVDGSTLERDYLPIDSAGRHAGHLWVYRDITQHIAERQMLTDQNRSLAELAALKNEFVATVSHELRTPLTSVVSFAEMLKDPSVGSLTPEQSTFLEIIDRNSQRLLRLIEDLLLVAKLESHTLPLSLGLVDLPDIVTQVVTELTPRAREKGVELGVDTTTGPKVRGDWVRLQQVVSNLVGNAINYTLPGGTVRVVAQVLPETFHWSIAISDNGVGIPEEEIPHVFDAFFRASSASDAAGSSGPGGTGLGLAISRLIVDEHHGRISVQSPPGVGTTVTVRLPYEGT
jgi:PAS domain S-box-containing protein